MKTEGKNKSPWISIISDLRTFIFQNITLSAYNFQLSLCSCSHIETSFSVSEAPIPRQALILPFQLSSVQSQAALIFGGLVFLCSWDSSYFNLHNNHLFLFLYNAIISKADNGFNGFAIVGWFQNTTGQNPFWVLNMNSGREFSLPPFYLCKDIRRFLIKA